MLLLLALILAAAWVFGFTFLHVTSFLIHMLIIVALVCVIMHFVRGSYTR